MPSWLVILEPTHPIEGTALILDAYDLTSREAQIAQLVLQWLSTNDCLETVERLSEENPESLCHDQWCDSLQLPIAIPTSDATECHRSGSMGLPLRKHRGGWLPRRLPVARTSACYRATPSLPT